MNEQTFTIRPAERRDIPRLLALLTQVNNVHHDIRPDLFVENKTKYDAGDLADMLGREDAPVFVCEDGAGFVCGYLFAVVRERRGHNLTGGRSFYIDDLCVDGSCRGAGIGGRLLAHAAAHAKALGCREILLNVWEGNDPALRFYRNKGFTPRSHLLELEI